MTVMTMTILTVAAEFKGVGRGVVLVSSLDQLDNCELGNGPTIPRSALIAWAMGTIRLSGNDEGTMVMTGLYIMGFIILSCRVHHMHTIPFLKQF